MGTEVYNKYSEYEVKNSNKRVKLPDEEKEIIKILESDGYEAYAVGGCVRDMLILPYDKVHDYDFTTNATPEQIINVFIKRGFNTINKGIRCGTVVVCKPQGKMYEITTYRVDGKYSDGRHPDNVEFVGDLVEDLSRRDFTINAMAISGNDIVIDPFNGIIDGALGVVRCVGNPDERFKEDPLRIIRAVRFAVSKGLKIEKDTFDAMRKNLHLIRSVSLERIKDELCKTFSENSSHYYFQGVLPFLLKVIGEVCWRKFKDNLFEYVVNRNTLNVINLDIESFMAIILSDSRMDITEIEYILTRMKFERKTIKNIEALIIVKRHLEFNSIFNHNLTAFTYESTFTEYVNKSAENFLIDYVSFFPETRIPFELYVKAAKYCMSNLTFKENNTDKFVEEIKSSGKCYSSSQLKINGDDIKNNTQFRHSKIRDCLDTVLCAVASGKLNNDRDSEIEFIKNLSEEDLV